MIDSPDRIAAAQVVPGTSEDLDAVMEVMEAAFGTQFGEAWTRSQCAGILPMAGVSLVLARDGESGPAVGFSLFRHVMDESELLLLAVTPSHRRRGVGRSLLHNFLELARSGGVRRVHLEVRDGNPAIEMYRGAGFLPIGRRRNYYQARDGLQFDALTFAREL
jgi:ribosomal-protein-alanine N-acetyltransferase